MKIEKQVQNSQTVKTSTRFWVIIASSLGNYTCTIMFFPYTLLNLILRHYSSNNYTGYACSGHLSWTGEC